MRVAVINPRFRRRRKEPVVSAELKKLVVCVKVLRFAFARARSRACTVGQTASSITALCGSLAQVTINTTVANGCPIYVLINSTHRDNARIVSALYLKNNQLHEPP